MKTLNLKFLFFLFLATGLITSCSSDDDVNDVLISPTRSSNNPDNSSAKSLNLNVTFGLDETTESLSCGEGALLYGHSGSGNSDNLGEFTMQFSYCGNPRTSVLSNVLIEIEDNFANKIFLRQKAESPFQEAPDEGTAGEVTGLNSNAEILNNDTDNLEFIITGGTGIYSNITGELSSLLPSNFSLGSNSVNLSFTGYYKAQ